MLAKTDEGRRRLEAALKRQEDFEREIAEDEAAAEAQGSGEAAEGAHAAGADGVIERIVKRACRVITFDKGRGKRWSRVHRRVTLDVDSGEIIADEVIRRGLAKGLTRQLLGGPQDLRTRFYIRPSGVARGDVGEPPGGPICTKKVWQFWYYAR